MAIKILVVEDSALMARYVIEILEKYGTVETAKNGKEGLSKVARGYFDMIVSDIHMPVMDGIEFYRAAVNIEPDINNRFLFFASSDSPENMRFCMENNIPFLHKLTSHSDDLNKAVFEILH